LSTNHQQKIEMLVDQRKKLEEEIRQLQQAISMEVDSSIDEADPSINERDKQLFLLQTLQEKLAKTNDALRATTTGTYGICRVCGQPIDPARLAIMPEATLCVPCKTATEHNGPR
jgi:DnaK suppressor protein